MSAFEGKADIVSTCADVRFWWCGRRPLYGIRVPKGGRV